MRRTTVYEFADTGMQFEYTEGAVEFRITDPEWEPEAGEPMIYTMTAETAMDMWNALNEITDKINEAIHRGGDTDGRAS